MSNHYSPPSSNIRQKKATLSAHKINSFDNAASGAYLSSEDATPEVYSPDADYHYKIILVGNRKVGKTTF